MSKASVASHLRALNGKRVVKRVSGVLTVDQIPFQREQILKLLKDNNIPAEKLIEDDNKFSVEGGTNFWIKPKFKKVEYGILTVRSKNYIFNSEETGQDSYGEKKGMTYSPDSIKVEKPLNFSHKIGGLISFELAE